MISRALREMIDCVTPADDRPLVRRKARSLEVEPTKVVPPPPPTPAQRKMRLVVGEQTTRRIALRLVQTAGPVSQAEILETLRRAGKNGIHLQKQVSATMRELEADGWVVRAPSPSWDPRAIWWVVP